MRTQSRWSLSEENSSAIRLLLGVECLLFDDEEEEVVFDKAEDMICVLESSFRSGLGLEILVYSFLQSEAKRSQLERKWLI